MATRRTRGFTLVEVMIAMVIMAILASMAWRGVDALVRVRQGSQQISDRTLRLSTGMQQFEYDLAQLVDTNALNSLQFDGNSLRLTRRHPQGVQLVMWTREDNKWQRWASAPSTHVSDLQEAWLRSQQWGAIAAEATPIADDVSQFQVYCYRENGWSNCQSSNNVTTVPAPSAATPPATPGSGTPGNPSSPASPNAPGAPGAPGTPKTGTTVTQDDTNDESNNGNGNGANNGQNLGTAKVRSIAVAPTGLRVVLTLPGGDITREQVLPPTGARAQGAM